LQVAQLSGDNQHMPESCQHPILELSLVADVPVYACKQCGALFKPELQTYQIEVQYGRLKP
jgi:hypothetical protein